MEEGEDFLEQGDFLEDIHKFFGECTGKQGNETRESPFYNLKTSRIRSLLQMLMTQCDDGSGKGGLLPPTNNAPPSGPSAASGGPGPNYSGH